MMTTCFISVDLDWPLNWYSLKVRAPPPRSPSAPSYDLSSGGQEEFRPMVHVGMETLLWYKNFHHSHPQEAEKILHAHCSRDTPLDSPPLHKDTAWYHHEIRAIPYSLFDRRQTVRYAVDLLSDSAALRLLIEHETAFQRYHPHDPTPLTDEQEYKNQWVQFDALDIVFFSGAQGEGEEMMARVIQVTVSPRVGVVDVPLIQEVIAFFTPSRSPKDQSPPIPAPLEKETTRPSPSQMKETIRSYWTQRPPPCISRYLSLLLFCSLYSPCHGE